MRRRSRVIVALFLSAVAVVGPIVAVLVSGEAREMLAFHTHKWRLDSSDPEAQARARHALLAMPRERIDGVYPRLIAEEVAEALKNDSECYVFVGHPVPATVPEMIAFSVDLPLVPDAKGMTLVAYEQRVCPGWGAARTRPIERALVVAAGRRPVRYTLVVPLDDDGEREPAIVEAVRQKLHELGFKP